MTRALAVVLVLLSAQACTVKECIGPDPHPECPRAQRFDYGDTGRRWDTGQEDPKVPVRAIWSIEEATFSDGAGLSGYVVIDHANDRVESYRICAGATPDGGLLSPGAEPWSAFEYRASTSDGPNNASSLTFNSYALFGPYSNSFRSLRLGEPPNRGPVENTGVSRSMDEGALECVNCAPSRYVLEGRWVLVPDKDSGAPDFCQ